VGSAGGLWYGIGDRRFVQRVACATRGET